MKSCIRKINAFLLVLCLSVLFTGCGKRSIKMTTADVAMGTVIQKTLYVNNEELGKDAMYEIGAYVDMYELEVLSWRTEISEVAKINAAAGVADGVELSDWLEEDLQAVWDISKKSGGALDVTIGQVTRLWNLDEWAITSVQDMQTFQSPEQKEIDKLLEYTGYEKVEIKNGRIYLPQGMTLDLGAVGKGIVCDEIGEYLSSQMCATGAIITLGGSVVTYGVKPDGSPWQVAVAHPREDGAYVGTILLKGEHYVATSGDYERYVEVDGTRYHHIIDPATGYPVQTDVCSVTIVSKSGLVSDALSTACFVLGTEKGMALAKEYNVHALFVTKDLEILMTEGMEDIFSLSK